jgi:hypothetical protein
LASRTAAGCRRYASIRANILALCGDLYYRFKRSGR